MRRGEGGLHLGETSLERRWEGSGDELGTVGVRASDPKCSVRLGVWCGGARRASGGGCGGSVVVGVGGVCASRVCVPLWLGELGAAGVAQVWCWCAVWSVLCVC